ncbi:hypothetical protein JW872_02805 [Candidatus Babeliales bacterium]|nr:hypothetical protein [Candidatus Babeliales bacterium]
MKRTRKRHITKFYALLWACVCVSTLTHAGYQDLFESHGERAVTIKEGPYYTQHHELHPETERILEKYQQGVASGRERLQGDTSVVSSQDKGYGAVDSYWLSKLISAGAIVVLGLLQSKLAQRAQRRSPYHEDFEFAAGEESDVEAVYSSGEEYVDPRDTGAGVEYRPPFEKIPMPGRWSDFWSGLDEVQVAEPREIRGVPVSDEATLPR